jgi:DNA replication and repair protein RecF
MRLAEAAFLKQNSGEEPILLLDDVLSELDTRRRHQILNVASSYQQAFVTTAEPALIMDSPVRANEQLSVLGGEVTTYG